MAERSMHVQVVSCAPNAMFQRKSLSGCSSEAEQKSSKLQVTISKFVARSRYPKLQTRAFGLVRSGRLPDA